MLATVVSYFQWIHRFYIQYLSDSCLRVLAAAFRGSSLPLFLNITACVKITLLLQHLPSVPVFPLHNMATTVSSGGPFHLFPPSLDSLYLVYMPYSTPSTCDDFSTATD